MKSEMRKRIVEAMRTTWDVIGTDMVEMVGWYMDRANIIEAVIDADRIGFYGGDHEAYEATRSMKMEELHSIGLEAFPFEEYGY